MSESEPSHLVTDFSAISREDLRIRDETVQTKLAGTEEDGDDLILSAYRGLGTTLFPKILGLHVPKGSRIADVTYGKGNFWQNVDINDYTIYASDIDPSKSPSGHAVSCHNLPYEDNSLDVVVLDPPYQEGFYRRNKSMLPHGQGKHSQFRDNYSSGKVLDTNGSKYHQAVLDMYCRAAIEAKRVLKNDGVLIVKVQDEVSANTQELTHIQITNFYESQLNMYTKDLFVSVRNQTPAVSNMHQQVHARKNHSFFMIYEMEGDPVNIIGFQP